MKSNILFIGLSIIESFGAIKISKKECIPFSEMKN